MKYLVVPDDEGKYVDKDNNRFNVIYGGFIVGPRAKEFKKFDTLQHALEYNGLIDPNAPVVEPEPTTETPTEKENVEVENEQQQIN